MAQIVNQLAAIGKLDQTYIIFTSDNGFFHGEHRVPQGKVLLYEPSIRVPLIIRGPNIPAGQHRSQFVENIDLAPTIVAATGAQPGRVMDGRRCFRSRATGSSTPGATSCSRRRPTRRSGLRTGSTPST